jgi:hypothetical protein
MAGDRPQVSFFISVHVPKTAGTSLATVLDRSLFRRVFFDYPSQADYYRPDPIITKNRAFITEWFGGIHGHFGASRHLADFGSAKYLATVRHPVDRIISQYLHEYNDPGPDSSWHKAIRSGQMGIVDFAAQDGVGNAMSKHLVGIDTDSYDLLLVTEQMNLSLHLLNYVIGNLHLPLHFGDPPEFPRLNVRAERPAQLEFDQHTRSEIYNRASADVEIYAAACELLKMKEKRYLR